MRIFLLGVVFLRWVVVIVVAGVLLVASDIQSPATEQRSLIDPARTSDGSPFLTKIPELLKGQFAKGEVSLAVKVGGKAARDGNHMRAVRASRTGAVWASVCGTFCSGG